MLVREADMGLFKKKNPQDAFDPDVFTIGYDFGPAAVYVFAELVRAC